MAAVDDHALAVNVLGHIAQEKRGEVRQFLVTTEALHRVFVLGVVLKLF